MTIKDPKYTIGEGVFHVIPESPKGVVINISYNLLDRNYSYQVAFSANEGSIWYYEHELTKERRIV